MHHRTIRNMLAVLTLGAAAGLAPAQLRVATWNISFYNGSDRASAIQTVVYGSFQGRQMAPDVIAAQEFASAGALSTFVGVLNSAPGSPGDWAAGPFYSGPDSQSVLVYRTSKVALVSSYVVALGGGTSGQPRNTYRFDVRPAGYSAATPGNVIAIYNVHLKAGSTSDDQARRLLECQAIRDNASGNDTNPGNGVFDGLPAGYHFIVCGDFNIQSSSQAAYQALVGAPALGRLFDPINTPGSWNNNGTFRFVHTQDPQGAGGMDDRHDQILLSLGLLDGQGMDYIGNPAAAYSTTTWNDPNHSYRVWGNDGTSFDLPLTTTGNTMVGPDIAQAVRDCTGGAGHVPVLLDIRVPPKAGTDATTIDFGTVVQNAAAPTRSVVVSNAGDTALWTANGIATLAYSLSASAGFTAPGGNFTDAATPGGNSHTLSMATSTTGPKSGTLTILSNDPDQPARTVTLVGNVVAANLPPVADAGPDQIVHDEDRTGVEPVTLHGEGSHDSDGTITNYLWKEGATTLASGPGATPTILLPLGVHTITLTVTDNGGATGSDTVVVTVNSPPRADAGPDQTVTDTDGSGDEPVTLDGTGSGDSDGTITNYLWKEGATTLAGGASPTAVVWLPVGPHTITLTVTDNRGGTASDSVQVTVEPAAPPCDPDLNQDGNADQDDVVYLVNVIGGGDNPTGIDPDFSGDGNVDQDDVVALINTISGGPCP
jgi:hypothetical protein